MQLNLEELLQEVIKRQQDNARPLRVRLAYLDLEVAIRKLLLAVDDVS